LPVGGLGRIQIERLKGARAYKAFHRKLFYWKNSILLIS
jgi:hypothetical protein